MAAELKEAQMVSASILAGIFTYGMMSGWLDQIYLMDMEVKYFDKNQLLLILFILMHLQVGKS